MTFDSSSATLTLPAGSSVLWAGLYWSGDTAAPGIGSAAPTPAANNTVQLKGPGAAAYTTLTAATLDTDALRTTRYQGFADVTSQVTAGGTGSYTVANVQAATGTKAYSGWALLVAGPKLKAALSGRGLAGKPLSAPLKKLAAG
ncbi:MAG: hypothetical protein ABI950_12505 [Solirubrobacteraceae bacterium]